MARCKSVGCNQITNTNADFCDECVEIHASLDEEINIDPHKPGAKIDQGKVRMHLITGGMARAITEVAKVATFGANKYTENGWIVVPNGFNRYEDAQQRHAASRHMDEEVDPESGLLHLAHEAWNALAKLDLYLRKL